MPRKKTPQQLTPGPSGTQWSEDLLHEPSQKNEPPIPGPSQSSKSQVPSHEDASTCEPEPEVAATKTTEEPFACPATPCSIIIINDMPVGSPGDPNCLLPSFPRCGSSGIYQLATNPDNSLINCPRLNQPNIVG
ncbi:hypothetical protein O181_008573 [Austropuccinia psidii MF-1]|uniref:Uncharacterized protein n=1 Tax=Austropuccinia psidii MF-1 TaxID=1389203 RepID=A0A9Q3BPE2_9BASI|nr:hypothetical protein [Austropuccinia psidii MF-1]